MVDHRLGTPTPATPVRLVRRGLAALTVAAALGVALAGCGGDDAGDSPSAVRTASNGDVYNAADVSFATEMMQHHAQALVMVDLTLGRELDPQVQELAEEIRAAQSPEIETMTDWLTAWGEEVPETVRDHGNAGHDTDDESGHGSDDMPGMMSGEDLAALEGASDAEFQDRWLELMVEHHEGAVEMANDEVADGEFAAAVAMAEDIAASQQREIDLMEDLLG